MERQDPEIERAIARLRAEGETRFGSAVERIDITRVLHRAFSSVVRATVVTADGHRVIYVKVFRSPVGDPTSTDRLRFRVEREFRETSRAYDIFHGRPGFSAMQGVALYPDLLALVTAEVRGQPFSGLLARGARPWSSTFARTSVVRASERVGQWLRAYQGAQVDGVRLDPDDLREYIDSRLRRLVAESVGGFSADRRIRLLREFDECVAGLDGNALQSVLVHADFCPENILVQPDGRVSVIDFAMAKPGLRYLDLSHLSIHLGFRSGITWRAPAIRAAKAALFHGFGQPDAEHAPGFRLAILVHVAALMADRLNRASRLPAGRRLWLAPQIRRCLQLAAS